MIIRIQVVIIKKIRDSHEKINVLTSDYYNMMYLRIKDRNK